MPSIPLETLSPFGRLAVQLDGDFAQLTRLSAQLQRLDLESDSDLDRAVKLLTQFAQHGQSITDNIQEFSRTLQEAHAQSEAATKLVAERSQLIHQRKLRQNQIRAKLAEVEHQVKTVNTELAGMRKPGKGEFSEEERAHLTRELQALNERLGDFVTPAQTIKEEAVQAKFKSIEREAQSLLDTLQASCRKLTKVLPAK